MLLLLCDLCFSYFYEDERGLFPETQFVFDLELPRSFEPTNTDEEVSDFYLLPLKEVSLIGELFIITKFFTGLSVD